MTTATELRPSAELALVRGWVVLAEANRHGAEHPSFRPGCPDCQRREAGRRNGRVAPAPSTRPCQPQYANLT